MKSLKQSKTKIEVEKYIQNSNIEVEKYWERYLAFK